MAIVDTDAEVRIAWWLGPSLRVARVSASAIGVILFLVAGERAVEHVCRLLESLCQRLIARGARWRFGKRGRWEPIRVDVTATHDPGWRLW